MRVICIGQAAYDITLPVNEFPEENEKYQFKGKTQCGGGSALICAYLLAKWGVDTYYMGVVGNDYYGDKIKQSLDEIGVNTKYLQRNNKAETTCSYIITNLSKGTRTILTQRDDNMTMEDVIPEEEFDVILLDGYEEEAALQVIKKNPKAIKIIDAGSLNESRIRLSKLVDYVVCSKDFAEDYTKMSIDYSAIETVIPVYKKLQESFKGKIVITLENKGCFTYNNGYKLIPTLKMKEVDTTGAGDIFHGAFTYCIANKFDLLKTLKISNITGAISVLYLGAQNSVPKKETVMDFYDSCC